ncbi:MAG: glycosyltransferase family 39 protein [Planctomycetaceae bacterium]
MPDNSQAEPSASSRASAASDSAGGLKSADAATIAGRCLLVFACLSSVLLMLPMFRGAPLALDEHVSYWVIDSDLPGSLLTRSLDYSAVPPLSSWLQQLSLKVVGKSESALRLPGALCHIATVLVVFSFGVRLRDPLLGGIAAVLVAWHPEALDEVRIARCYGLVLLMSAVVVAATWRWLTLPASMTRAMFWTVSAAGLLWTHYTSGLLVVIAAACVGGRCLATRNRGLHFSVWLVAMLALMLVCLPLIPSVLRLRDLGEYLNYMADDQTLRGFIGPMWWLGLPAGWIVTCLAGRSSGEPRFPMKRDAALLLACSLLPALMLAVLAAGDLPSLANPRYRVACVPAGACLMALVLRRGRRWPAAVAGTAVLLISSWALAPVAPWQPGRLGDPTDAEWKELGRFISEYSRPGEAIFVQSGLVESHMVPMHPDDSLLMENAACRAGRFYIESTHPRLGLPFVWNDSLGMRPLYRDFILSSPLPDKTFWIAIATDTDLNRNSLPEMREIAESAGFVRGEHHEWPHVTLERYRLAADPQL